MQKSLLMLFSCFLLPTFIHAQSGFLLLKKRHKTIETFYKGSYINFKTDKDEWIDAHINDIANDTLYLKRFELVHYIDAWGMPAQDTLWGRQIKIAIKNIAAFPQKDRSLGYIRNGAILQIAGAGYIILNVINTLSAGDALFEDNNAMRLGIAAAVFAIGTLIRTSHSTELRLGRKYKLQYVKM
jgi:hypothetical protein